jgi:hypothetical protein
MSNTSVTYLVGACAGVFGLVVFCTFVLAPAVTSYRRIYERATAVVLSLYVLAACVGVGVLLGALIIIEWPRVY